MKKIMFVTFITLTIGTAQAAIKTVQAASNNSSSTMNYSHKETGFKFEARPGAGTVDGKFTYGASLEGKYGFDMGRGNTLFAGLESGFYRNSTSLDPYTSFYNNMIPIKATGSFEFPVSRNLRLSANVGLGIAIISQGYSLDSAVYGNTPGASDSATKFIWSAGPGMLIGNTFVATLPVGTVDGVFTFLPSLGARF